MGSNPVGCTNFFVFFREFELKTQVLFFFAIPSDSIKFLPSQTENATFLPHKIIPSATSKKIEKFFNRMFQFIRSTE